MGENVEIVLGIRDGIQVHSSFHTDVKELEYKDLLTNAFTQADHEMDMEKEIWSVMEDFSKSPGCKDFNKMKVQYVMLVDVVTSKQVCVLISP